MNSSRLCRLLVCGRSARAPSLIINGACWSQNGTSSEEVTGVSRKSRRKLGGSLGQRGSSAQMTVLGGRFPWKSAADGLSKVISATPDAFLRPFLTPRRAVFSLPFSIASLRRWVAGEAEGWYRRRAAYGG